MKIVATLGGNALLRRGEPLSHANQIANIRKACSSLARIACRHELVLGHGNGPQVGLLAEQSEIYATGNPEVPPYPFDVLGAQSQAMIGYLMAQELRNLLPEREIVCIVTQTEVDPGDPAFSNPAKFVGAVMDKATALSMADKMNWTVKQDGASWRRVVPSPEPRSIIELPVIDRLVRSGCLVISAGGGGVPVIKTDNGLKGVEAVIDKDFAASLLAVSLHADLLVIATDVDGVYADWGTPAQRIITKANPHALREQGFAAGSMGPKVLAACRYAASTGHEAVVGALDKIEEIVEGRSGTRISLSYEGITYANAEGFQSPSNVR